MADLKLKFNLEVAHIQKVGKPNFNLIFRLKKFKISVRVAKLENGGFSVEKIKYGVLLNWQNLKFV